MARAKPTKSMKSSSGEGKSDAISLLETDHRMVEDLFEQFKTETSQAQKQELATQICKALRIHTMLEEEIFYPAYLARLEAHLGCRIPFRIAETPLFLPERLRDGLARSANEIVQQLSNPALVERMKRAIPPHLDVPRMDALPNCTQVDFAITRGPDGGGTTTHGADGSIWKRIRLN